MNLIAELSPLIGQVESEVVIRNIALGVAGYMFFWALKEINGKLTSILDKINSMDTRVAVVETKIEHIEEQLNDE